MAYLTGHTVSVRTKKKSRHLSRLLACAILFLLAVVAKISGIPNVSETVCAWIGADLAEEHLSSLGMSMTDPAHDVMEVFSRWTQETFGVESAAEEIIPAAETAVPQIADSPVVSVIDTPDALLFAPTALPSESDVVPVAVPTGQVSIGDATEDIMPVSEISDGEMPVLPDVVSTEAISIDYDYVTPVTGYITSSFGYRDHPLDGVYKFHYGVDIGAAEGTPILAFADGVVNTVLKGEINGNYFKVGHDDGIVSMYAHCQKIVVKAGQQVKKGDVIAYVGQTGQVSGPHLHFQLYKNGKIIDPTTYLELSA